MIDREIAFESYLETALWSSVEISEDGNIDVTLDENYDTDDFSPEAREELLNGFNDFCNQVEAERDSNGHLLHESDDYISDEMLGYDFWLTHNGHGAGFFDGDWGILGDKLTEMAKVYSGIDLYTADGMVHI